MLVNILIPFTEKVKLQYRHISGEGKGATSSTEDTEGRGRDLDVECGERCGAVS